MSRAYGLVVDGFVILFGVYSVAKFAVFFLRGYASRRNALDSQYTGRTSATKKSDPVLLAIAVCYSIALLLKAADPMAFLGGLLVGATLIQLFFHAFDKPLPAERIAPEPRSPIKMMSYAIQDEPARAWKEMLVFTALVLTCLVLYRSDVEGLATGLSLPR